MQDFPSPQLLLSDSSLRVLVNLAAIEARLEEVSSHTVQLFDEVNVYLASIKKISINVGLLIGTFKKLNSVFPSRSGSTPEIRSALARCEGLYKTARAGLASLKWCHCENDMAPTFGKYAIQFKTDLEKMKELLSEIQNSPDSAMLASCEAHIQQQLENYVSVHGALPGPHRLLVDALDDKKQLTSQLEDQSALIQALRSRLRGAGQYSLSLLSSPPVVQTPLVTWFPEVSAFFSLQIMVLGHESVVFLPGHIKLNRNQLCSPLLVTLCFAFNEAIQFQQSVVTSPPAQFSVTDTLLNAPVRGLVVFNFGYSVSRIHLRPYPQVKNVETQGWTLRVDTPHGIYAPPI